MPRDHSIVTETLSQLFGSHFSAGDYRTNRGEHSDVQITGAGESRALLSRTRGVAAGEASELSAAAGGQPSSDQQAQAADAATAGIISRR